MVFMNRARAAHGFIALPAPHPSLASLDAQFLYTKPFLCDRSRARHFICFSPCDLHEYPRQVCFPPVIAGLSSLGYLPKLLELTGREGSNPELETLLFIPVLSWMKDPSIATW